MSDAQAAPARTTEERQLLLVTATVMLGMIMAIIDSSIVNVALNQMAGNLGATIDEIAWVATGYILANVIIMPLNGWLTALFGRKRFYAACIAIFTITSFLCGTATSVGQLIFYRILQGIGGGALQPTAQSILFETFPPEKRGQGMAWFGIGAMVGPAIGPTLGGYIVDNFNWPLIFFINVPIGILAFFMTLWFIPNPHYIKKPERGADWLGLGMMTAGIASLQYVLERGQRDDWFHSTTIDILSVIAAFGIVFFVLRELSERDPFVDLSVFRSRAFSAGSVIGVIMGFGLFGLNLILPLFFQTVLGFNAWQTGLALLPGAIATAVSMPLAGRAAAKYDPRITIGAGLVVFAISAWWMGSLNQYAGFWDVFWPRVIQGFSMGFVFVPLTTASLGEVPRHKMPNASGIYTLIRQLGGSLGIALLQLLQTRREDTAQAALAASINQANPAVSQMLAQAQSHTQTLQQLYDLVQQNALVVSYDYIFRFSAIVFILTVPTVLLLRGQTPQQQAISVAAD